MKRLSVLLVVFFALLCSHASAKSSNYVFSQKFGFLFIVNACYCVCYLWLQNQDLSTKINMTETYATSPEKNALHIIFYG